MGKLKASEDKKLVPVENTQILLNVIRNWIPQTKEESTKYKWCLVTRKQKVLAIFW